MTFDENNFQRYILAVNIFNMNTEEQARTTKQKQAMIDAIEANFGNITKAAKEVGINVRTHNRWRKEDNDYDTQFVKIKDVSYVKVKDSLLEEAMKRIKKGDSTVLNQMLRLFYKNLPEDMIKAARVNDIPVRATIKWVSTPQDPRREGYVKPE